jgi:putative mRNA 3-end processing factor
MTLLRATDRGLYCEAGDFFVDPWAAVDRAVVTHAHGDHVAWGCRAYLTSADGVPVLRERLEPSARIRGAPYGEPVDVGGVRISLHPAGHVLGSAQVRVEHAGEVWVVSGDYKLDPDPTCAPFEPVRCHTFVTESTFGLPIYRWQPPARLADAINGWWRANAEAKRASLIFAYAFGKAQRILASIDASLGPILVHGAVDTLNRAYAAAGVRLPDSRKVTDPERPPDPAGALVIAPPSAQSTPWLRRFGDYADAFASGWMAIRGARRRQAVDQGFTLSDHADWPGLNRAIAATGAERIFVTHGQVGPMVRWLAERGLDAQAMPTEFEGEAGAEEGLSVAKPAGAPGE